MSRYTSEQPAYSSLKKKYVPLWKLDSKTVTVTHFNTDTQIEESKTYNQTSSGTIFISLTAIVPTGFAGSSMKVKSCNTSMIWSRKSVMLSPVRWSFGSRLTVAIRKLFSAVMPRRCSVWKNCFTSMAREAMF